MSTVEPKSGQSSDDVSVVDVLDTNTSSIKAPSPQCSENADVTKRETESTTSKTSSIVVPSNTSNENADDIKRETESTPSKSPCRIIPNFTVTESEDRKSLSFNQQTLYKVMKVEPVHEFLTPIVAKKKFVMDPGFISWDEVDMFHVGDTLDLVFLGEGSRNWVCLGKIKEMLVAIKLFVKAASYGTEFSIIDQAAKHCFFSCDLVPKCFGLAALGNKNANEVSHLVIITLFVGDAMSYETLSIRKLFDINMRLQNPTQVSVAETKCNMYPDNYYLVDVMKWKKILIKLVNLLVEIQEENFIYLNLTMDIIMMQKVCGVWRPYLINFSNCVYNCLDDAADNSQLRELDRSKTSLIKFLCEFPHLGREVYDGDLLNFKSVVFSFGHILHQLAPICSPGIYRVLIPCRNLNPDARPELLTVGLSILAYYKKKKTTEYGLGM